MVNEMSDITLNLIGVGVVTFASYYRVVTINSHSGYQKDEDAYFRIYKRDECPIGRALIGTKIIRERTIWECIAILINGIVFIATILIETKIKGQVEFLYSKTFNWWFAFTVLQIGIWELGLYIYIRFLIFRKKERIKLPESPKNKSILELEKTAEHYASIYDPIDDSNIYVLNAYRPIYCLRDKGDYYRVAYFDEIVNDHQSVILYLFDKNGQKLLYEEVHNPVLGKEDFLELKPGTLVSEVKEMDIRGIYSGFQKSSTDKRSLHITNDWHFIEIHYDYDYRIQEVVCELL